MTYTFTIGLVVGTLLGALIVYVQTRWWDFRPSSMERAYRKALKLVRKYRLTAATFEKVMSPLDLEANGLSAIADELHREGLSMEEGSDVVDRLKMVLGGGAKDPHFVLGWRRSMANRRAYPALDKQVQAIVRAQEEN